MNHGLYIVTAALSAALGATHVVELPAGALRDVPLAPGDSLRIENRT